MLALWEELIRSRAFWIAYLSASTEFRLCDSLIADDRVLMLAQPAISLELEFELNDDHSLRLRMVRGENLLQHLDSDVVHPQLIGCMNSHQMSDCFRWEEFQAIVAHLAKSIQPKWACELLLSSYVAVIDDCAESHSALLQRTLEASELFASGEIRTIVSYSRRFARRRDFRWIHSPEIGWFAEGDNCYSLRDRRDDFDFARFNAMLSAISLEQPE